MTLPMAGFASADTIRRHRWYPDFRWSVPDAEPQTLTRDQVAQYDRDGYLVLGSVFTPEEVARVLARTDSKEARLDRQLREHADGKIGTSTAGGFSVVHRPAGGARAFSGLTRHPIVLGICRDLLGPDVDIFDENAFYKRSERAHTVVWHQDHAYVHVDPPTSVAFWISLTDATLQNGCIEVAPGLHRHGPIVHDLLDEQQLVCFDGYTDAVSLPVPAGSIIVLSSLMPHSTAPNRSTETRKAYHAHFAVAGSESLAAGVGPLPERSPLAAQLGCQPVLRGGAPIPMP